MEFCLLFCQLFQHFNVSLITYKQFIKKICVNKNTYFYCVLSNNNIFDNLLIPLFF